MYISKKTLDHCSKNYETLSKEFLEKLLQENRDGISAEFAMGLLFANPVFLEGVILGLLLADQQRVEDLESLVREN